MTAVSDHTDGLFRQASEGPKFALMPRAQLWNKREGEMRPTESRDASALEAAGACERAVVRGYSQSTAWIFGKAVLYLAAVDKSKSSTGAFR